MPRLRGPLLAIGLIAIALVIPLARHRWIQALLTYDAVPSEPVELPLKAAPPLPPAKTRVLLIDGLSASVAADLPNWRALCGRGAQLVVDVGFPTVSLPVEAELWSGQTQQQSGIVFRSDVPLEPPLVGIPSHVAGSRAVAEDHGWIVRSLGFSRVSPSHEEEADLSLWHAQWLQRARDAVTSDAPLAFVHVLRVDTAGHRTGRDSPLYRVAAGSADAILAELVALEPDARWFVLSDHGHLAEGGHGGEELQLRQVEGCIAGPDVPHVSGGPVHVIDIAHAIADSVGVTLDPASRSRTLAAAIAAPLAPDQALPALPLPRGALAILIVFVAIVSLYFTAKKIWLAPWWFVVGWISLVAVHGEPTLSKSMVWAPTGRAMYLCWLPALVLAAATSWFGLPRAGAWRVVAAQLALPAACVAAAITATGAWPLLVGMHVAPIVPHVTAWLSPLLLIFAHGCAAVALAVLARTVQQAFGRPSPPETPSSARAAE